MNWAWLASAAAFAVAMTATPGPNNTMVAASGANYGFRATVPHLLGICAGFPVMLLMIGSIGLTVVTIPVVHLALKWIGIAYLLWLAWHIAMAAPAGDEDEAARGNKPLTFLQAALFQWVNPKAWIIAGGALVAYIAPGSYRDMLLYTAILGAIFSAIAFPCVALWTLLGVGASRLLKTPMAWRVFNWTLAGLLVLSLVPVALEK